MGWYYWPHRAVNGAGVLGGLDECRSFGGKSIGNPTAPPLDYKEREEMRRRSRKSIVFVACLHLDVPAAGPAADRERWRERRTKLGNVFTLMEHHMFESD